MRAAGVPAARVAICDGYKNVQYAIAAGIAYMRDTRFLTPRTTSRVYRSPLQFLLAVVAMGSSTNLGHQALPPAEPYDYSSRYLTVRDGVRIAVDVYLPTSLVPGTRLPAIFHQTRYFRAHDVRWFATPFFRGVLEPTIARYVARGYAYVVIDTRGSGASFGTRSQEFAPDEVRDAYEIADWIVARPWSSGSIGAVGGSYEGAVTEFLAGTGHPAVKAIIPQNCLFDAYTDMAFPGGVPFSRFLRLWGPATAALDPPDVRLGAARS